MRAEHSDRTPKETGFEASCLSWRYAKDIVGRELKFRPTRKMGLRYEDSTGFKSNALDKSSNKLHDAFGEFFGLHQQVE
jgi:hypothetical protein